MMDDDEPLGGLHPVLVGYGKAGSSLHHHSLGVLAGSVPVTVVDPRPPARCPAGARWVPTLPQALAEVELARAVFHVTTPVHQHLPVVAELLANGASAVIVEKPLAPTASQARQLATLATGAGTVVPVGVWTWSAITARVLQIVADGTLGEVQGLHFEQSKPRFSRTERSAGVDLAALIELPHQLLLALHLAGPVASLEEATSWSMPLPDGRELPGCGGVDVTFTHADGIRSRLVSDLTSSSRIRRLTVFGTRRQVVADYPVSADDATGQIQVSGVGQREITADAPLTRFIEEAYAHFAGRRRQPPERLDTHVQVAELVDDILQATAPLDRSEGDSA